LQRAPPTLSPSSWTPAWPPICAPSSRPTKANVTVVQQDVLSSTSPLPQPPPASKSLVFGNLPYYITSQILLKLAASHASLDRAILMVQREVADRITAKPGSRDYGLLSVTVQMYGPAENLFTLPPNPSRLRPMSTPPSSAGALPRASRAGAR
jgi:16S rRNA A1518/A1519 N6-dimethyltransferase RsmA/KsgA/DIM1 with predicted DNA glycosylase/AP lyase activity